MTIQKFEPVAQVVEELGTGKKVIFDSNKALYETPLWVKLYSAGQLTEAYEAGKREQAAELAAEQAKNAVLRDALNRLQEACNGEDDNEFYAANSAATKYLSAPSDTSALEAMIAKAGEVMREKCEKVCDEIGDSSNGWCCEGAIRAVPGVTLEDLK